jgi:hypothetical protein
LPRVSVVFDAIMALTVEDDVAIATGTCSV